MRAHLTRIIAAGAASISEGVQEPQDVVDEILDALMEPTDEMLDAPTIVMDEPWNIRIGFQAMIRAAKEGK